MLNQILAQCRQSAKTLHFFPQLYNGVWHVSIRDGNITYWLYDYHRRVDCINECRVLNRRHNVEVTTLSRYVGGDS